MFLTSYFSPFLPFAMKNLPFFLGMGVAFAQAPSGPLMTFEKTAIDYGIIDKGVSPTQESVPASTGGLKPLH